MSESSLVARRAVLRAKKRDNKKKPKMRVSGKGVLQLKRLRETK